MNYAETIEYLYNSAPLFQQVGAGAYKSGLETTITLDEHFHHPHTHFKTIHVAGTNGKGSCSHTLAAILQAAGYRVGLYTSPHLVDFRERIRVNGEMISEQYVIDFVEQERYFFEPLHPSFFELTTALAFKYFADTQVNVAIIEVGLGGRLDCTNIIHPDLCVITNISFDHVQFLGSTLTEIAGEKAGIIKPHTPVVIGEALPETRFVFEQKAETEKAPIYFAEDNKLIQFSQTDSTTSPTALGRRYQTLPYGSLFGELGGACQEKNTNTILCALPLLQQAGYQITDDDVRKGFAEVCERTGLMGRWQRLDENPITICDTGHNVGGLQYIAHQLQTIPCKTLRIVIGMVNDKDISGVLHLLPQNATYYFTQASVKRAMPVSEFAHLAKSVGLNGNEFSQVSEAYNAARKEADKDDLIFVGGSSFIVADLLTFLKNA